jgi:FkbH-like protein
MPDLQAPGDGKIVVAATFVAEPLLPGLSFVLNKAGLALSVYFSPYHQVFQQLLSSTSQLATNEGGINVVLVRIEDFVREVGNIEEARSLVERTLRELSDALSQYTRRAKVPTVLGVLPKSAGAPRTLSPDIDAASAKLVAHARSLHGVAVLSEQEIELVSSGEHYDPVGDELAHMPFTEEHYSSLALAIARKVHALVVPSHKVLVLDCDDTLWRGVVGEDGVEGIMIPQAFAKLQGFAAEIQAKGALICLVSKNAERDVLDVFETRPDMVLKLEQIVAHRINWEAKSRNIASLARALNLGLDSFVYMDDSPVECARMRAELPQVVTLQIPPEHEIEEFLSRLWTFDKIGVTTEDTRRTSMYRENAARQELEESATDIVEFIASLGVIIDIGPPENEEWPRIAQLTQRTNQFNFTTVRRTESDLRALPTAGSIVLRVKVRDRFGDYGLVGLVVADAAVDALVVDTLLLSCRVLGRGVEHAILRMLGEIASARALPFVFLPFVYTPKNEPAYAFAESIASSFRTEEGDRVLYRIPVVEASSMAHRPGHDPAAVIEARKSEENKNSTSDKSSLNSSRSERYTTLARELASGRDVVRAMRARGARRRTLPGEAKKPATEIENKLLALWQELLGIDGLGVEDDYFALGGTSLLAARLFAEIAHRFSVKLPLTTILESPTVSTLSRHLEPHRIDRAQSLIELRRGGPRNFFFVHDGDGETLLYLNLARRMPNDLAVFGIEPRRREGVPLAHTFIEDMAAFYVEALRKKQPHGPYLLGGMCAGGVIAHEMAVQLVRLGEKVELVALLDAATPQAPKLQGRITKQRLERLGQAFADGTNSKRFPMMRAVSVAGTISRKLISALTWEILHRGRQWSVRARFGILHNLLARQREWPRFVPGLSVRQIYDSAEASYVPKPLSGVTVLLVRACASDAADTPYREIYDDETLGWDAITDNLKLIDVEGGHSSMLQEPFVDSLAAALMPHLTRKPASTYARLVEMAK